MIQIEKAIFDDDTIEQLIRLSKKWAEEDICFGMVANDVSDLKEPCFLAKEEGQIVGYIFGHFYTQEKKLSGIETGSNCFDVDECYVLPKYRSLGIGKMLFDAIQKEVKEKASYITLVTSTKDFRRILSFYVDDIGMTFHDAFLFKKLED